MTQNLDSIFIIKTDGSLEPWQPEKIHSHLKRACAGLNVDLLGIIKGARLKIFDKARSADIQNALIKAAQEKISEEHPEYEIAAGRLLNQKIRKEVYGQFMPKPFADEVKSRVASGLYDQALLSYSDAELTEIGEMLDYDTDDSLPYSSLNRIYNSYTIKHNGKAIETPQEIFALIPMAVFYEHPERMQMIKLGYRLLKERKISLPTPIMNGARSPFRHFVSCNLINAGDSVKSLSEGSAAIMQCTASKSGLGINASFIRGLGASIGKPERVKHTGILPLIKTFEAAVHSLTQVGRQGSCNISMPFWHSEIELFTQLGDSRGSLENRARHTDQTVIINKWFLEKALAKEDIGLFYTNDVPGLYDALGDYKKFDSLYNEYRSKACKTINAFDLLKLILSERMMTGRVYLTLADNSCKGSFKENLYFTNLCCLTGDTLVRTPFGDTPIRDIVAGDTVISYNTDTGENETKKVLAATKTGVKRIVEVHYNGKVVRCTADHKFLTQRGWVAAADLKDDDVLVEYDDGLSDNIS